MTERERLVEEYENAYFAVLMYDLAEHEGQQLIAENEKLKNDSEFAVPEAVQMRALGTIRRAFRKEKALAALKHSKLFISKVAVVFLMVSALFTTAYAAVPEVRASTLNLLIKVSDVSTSLLMEPGTLADESVDDKLLLGYRIPEIPDGYELRHEDYSDIFSVALHYTNSSSEYLYFSVVRGENNNYTVDTENAEIKHIEVNGFDGLLITKDGEKCVTLADTDNGYHISIYGSDIDDKELLRMLSEMVYITE